MSWQDATNEHAIIGARLPNLIVYIDLREGQPTAPSLFALSEARRVAHRAGVTVLAVVMSDPRPASELEPVTRRLGVAGADKVLVCEGTGLGEPALDATHGPALMALAERVPPLVVLFPAGGPGPELGPPLAARLGGAFGGCSDLELSDEAAPLPNGVGRLHLRRWRGDRSSYRRLDPVEIERPVVAIVGAFGVAEDLGTPDVEVDVIPSPVASDSGITVVHAEPDEMDAVALARGLVIVGADLAPEVAGDVVAKLQTLAPDGVLVADARRVRRGALAVSAPQFVLQIGTPATPVGGSPQTRVGRIVLGKEPDRDQRIKDAGVDVVWRPSVDVPWDELATALGAAASDWHKARP